MVSVCLIFGETVKQFSRDDVLFHLPTGRVGGTPRSSGSLHVELPSVFAAEGLMEAAFSARDSFALAGSRLQCVPSRLHNWFISLSTM